MSNKKIARDFPTEQGAAIVSRRGFLKFAGASSLATAAGTLASAARAANSSPDGTPEQIHLTWGNDPTSEVTVSWASPAPAVNPKVRFGGAGAARQTVHGVQNTYTDGINGEVVFTYHARLRGLKADTRYEYEVSADNDSNAAQPFTASFRTAPRGPRAISLDELRRSRHPQYRLGPVVAAEPFRGAGR